MHTASDAIGTAKCLILIPEYAPKADINRRIVDVRFVPKPDMQLSDPECAITAEMPAPR
jgi:hypothetical protein